MMAGEMTRGQILLVTIIASAVGAACTLIIGGVRDPWIILATAGLNSVTATMALLKNLPKEEWTEQQREDYRRLLEAEAAFKQKEKDALEAKK